MKMIILCGCCIGSKLKNLNAGASVNDYKAILKERIGEEGGL
jgi:hypothetical protein